MKAAAFLLLALLTLAAGASPLLALRAREQARLSRRLAAIAPGDAPESRPGARLTVPTLAAPLQIGFPSLPLPTSTKPPPGSTD